MKKRGFTLVEILVVTALLLVFNFSLWQLLKGGVKAYRKAKIIAELERNANQALSTIANDYSYALYVGSVGEAMETPSAVPSGMAPTGTTLDANQPGTGVNPGNEQNFFEFIRYINAAITHPVVVEGTPDPTDILTVGTQQVKYHLGTDAEGTGLLYRTMEANKDMVVAKYISNISFQLDPSDPVRATVIIRLTLNYPGGSESWRTMQLSSKVCRRPDDGIIPPSEKTYQGYIIVDPVLLELVNPLASRHKLNKSWLNF